MALPIRLTERDIRILAWLGRFRAATVHQISWRFGMGENRAYRRLRQLLDAGLLRHERLLYGRPGVYLATADGLAVAELELPPPQLDIRAYRHDLAVVDLAIEAELAGEVVVSEREMRSREAIPNDSASLQEPLRYAVELADGGGQRSRRHFADLLLERAGGRWAVELELGDKRDGRLVAMLRAYRDAAHLAGVLYYAEQESLRQRIERLAEQLELGERLDLRRWPASGR